MKCVGCVVGSIFYLMILHWFNLRAHSTQDEDAIVKSGHVVGVCPVEQKGAIPDNCVLFEGECVWDPVIL